MKHTKIVCTIGPASNTKTRLEQMIRAGMNVARLNFSHGDYSDHAKLIQTIRTAAEKNGKQIALMQDLQGPRIRVGEVPKEGIEIRNGDTVLLVSQKEYQKEYQKGNGGDTTQIAIPIQYPQLAHSVKVKGDIAIQDGMIALKIKKIDTTAEQITCRVVQGGVIFSHKGLNAPGVTIEAEVITKKDKEDLKFGIKQGVDYVALSFVKDAQNVQQLRRLIPKAKGIKIIAKIERQEAVDNFDEILEAVDGVMIARGDLGVELGAAEVPLLQKEMIMKCLQAAKPVIVATQMLESMTTNPRPTRAEAADVANAIIDHTDAIMLSGESAAGLYPVKAVQTMAEIARKVEQSRFDDLSDDLFRHHEKTRNKGVAHAAVYMADAINARAIAVLSYTGTTATLVSQLRPQKSRIVVFTNRDQVLRQLALVWGVRGVKMRQAKDKQQFIRIVRQKLLYHKIAKKGDMVVVVSGFGAKKGLGVAEAIEI